MKGENMKTVIPEEMFFAPLKVEPMRVRRTYSGGEGIDRWHGQPNQYGKTRPEEWLASVTGAVNPGFSEEPGEGLSNILWNGQELRLKALIEAYPAEMLGSTHRGEVGDTLGVLAKIIDSAERLSIQVHPDKSFSRKWFNSEYGKTECWYILDSSPVGAEQPYLLMGFRPGVTKEQWRHLYETQDIQGMIDCMHKITPKKGEVWLIEGGLPHAIGPGCFLMEIQEPTDYTMRTETTRSDGTPLPEQLIHQGAGEKGLLECFHYDTVTQAELREKHCIPGRTVGFPGAGCWTELVGPRQTSCFSMAAAQVNTRLDFPRQGGFAIAVVLRGSGRFETKGGCTEVVQGDQLFLPASMEAFALLSDSSEEPMEVLLCYPPKAKLPCPGAPAQNI